MRYIGPVRVAGPRLHRLVVVVAAFALFGCEFVASVRTPPPNAGVPTASAEVVALAGPDLVVLEGAAVTLSGLGSRALIGTPTLSWSQTAGPPAALSNPSSSTPTFTAPFAPARLVFSLTAAVDDEHDADEVVVDVVRTGPLPRPLVQIAPPDVVARADEPVSVRFPWRGRGAPAVRPRCALRDATTVDVGADDVVVQLRPADLPCAIVVDDAPSSDGGGDLHANRIAIVVWPDDVALPEPTRASTRAIVDPGDVVDIAAPGALVGAVDGSPLSFTTSASGTSFVAPRHVGPLLLVAERRAGGVSGGTVAVALAVRAGDGNSAPEIALVDDLVVRPGARFRIIARTTDPDDDALTLVQRQVLGDEARVDVVGSDARIAPEAPGTLLFHVVADDGVVESAPVAVRVVVDTAAENRAPELVLPASIAVVPGEHVVLDASSARDPDTGEVAAFRIQQQADDAVIVLPSPIDEARAEFVAPGAGVALHFLVSAYDDGGLGVTVPVTVFVESAGPFVDVARGADDGDGTADRPFATIAAALATAARHRFPAIRLAEGVQAAFDGALPDGLGLVGGHRFDGAGYVDDGPSSTVPLGVDGLAVTGGDVRRVTLSGGALHAVRSVSVVDSNVGGGIRLAPGARLAVVDTVVADGIFGVRAAISLERSTVAGGVDVEDTSVECSASTLDGAPGLRARGGDVFVTASEVRSSVRGIEFADASAVVHARVTVDGAGAGADVAGIVVDGGVVTLDDATVAVTGAGVAAGIAVDDEAVVDGVIDVTVLAPAARGVTGGMIHLVDSVVAVEGDEVTGVDVVEARLERTRVSATGARATALRATRGEAQASVLRATPPAADTSDTVDVVAAVVGDVSLRHVTFLAPTAVRAVGGLPVLRNAAVVANVAFDGVVDAGVVGVVGAAFDPAACPRCIAAAPGAVDATGHLAPDSALGPANPLVDVGDLDDAVAVDIDGDTVPVGAGPDVGADERSAP